MVQTSATIALDPPERVFSVTTAQIAQTQLAKPHADAKISNAERDQRTVELLTESLDGDALVRETAETEAVELNMPLARYLASRYRRRGIPDDDLEQVAFLGLMKAVRGFSPERANSFAAYAIPTIRGELRKHFRDAGWTIRPPRRIQELQIRIRTAEADLVQQLCRTPSVNELAEKLNVEVEELLEATSLDGCFTPHSLDAPRPGGDSDLTPTPGTADPAFDDAEARIVLAPALERLCERDRRIIDLRFVQGLTQSQIGEVVGVSQMQVSRILTRVLEEMRGVIVGEAAA
ncbi:MAG: sigma-70 region 4 domain protein [Marmoricola sp.]|nr:sigma-70 region 4 domain protein [Marmoricola sp.]